MSRGNGANIPAAIAAFRAAGYTVRQIADDLGLHRSTIYRWANGQRRPNRQNFEALVELVDGRHAQAINGRIMVGAVHLTKAAERLETTEHAERLEALAADIRATLAASEGRRESYAEWRTRIAGQAPSATAAADPFSLVGRDRELELAEATFS